MNMREHFTRARVFTLLLTLLLSVSLLAGCGSGNSEVFELMEEGKYTKAVATYKKLSSDERKELADEAKAFAEKTMAAFTDGSMDPDETLECLGALESMKFSELEDYLEESVISVLDACVKARTEAYLAFTETAEDALYAMEEMYEFYPFDDMDDDPVAEAMEKFADLHVETLLKNVETGMMSFDSALSALDVLNTYSVGYKDVFTGYDQFREDFIYKLYFVEGKAFFNAGNYKSALEKFQLIPESDGNYQEALTMITSANENLLKQLFDAAQEYANQSQFDSAISVLQESLYSGLDDNAIQQKIEEYTQARNEQQLLQTLEEAKTLANRLANDNRYDEAFSTLNNFINNHYYSASDYVMEQAHTALTEIQNRYADTIEASVTTLRAEGKYLKALNLLNDCLIPDFDRINALREQILAEKPTYLCEMEDFLVNSNSLEYVWSDTVKDSIGNTYEGGNVYQFYSQWYGSYCDYYLGKKYTRLTGIVAVADYSSNYKGKLVIEDGDGNELLTIKLSRTMTPVVIDLDISDVEFLHIEIKKNGSSDTPRTYMIDFAFEPVRE